MKFNVGDNVKRLLAHQDDYYWKHNAMGSKRDDVFTVVTVDQYFITLDGNDYYFDVDCFELVEEQ
jgi:hypothetical protein